MTSILDKDLPASQIRVTSSLEKFLHTRDLETYGKGMTRDLRCIGRLLQLSRGHNLDPSLMRGCLVSILFALLRLNPSNQQEVRLVNEYLEIIEEEIDVTAWSFSVAEFFINQRSWPYGTSYMVLYLLRGRHIGMADDYVPEYGGPIIQEYDLKLSSANAQPTTSIPEVMDYVDTLSSIIGLNLRNAWLSLYVDNRTRSPHNSAIPTVWSSDCASIASNRLSLYGSGLIPPEIDLVLFFLSCPSASIARRALHWYLGLKDSTIAYNDPQGFHFIPHHFLQGSFRR